MINSLSKSQPRAMPFVFVNMAMTADGKIATANRAISSFGSAQDRHHLLLLRSKADAVMAGARTVDSNPINLGPGPQRYRRLRLKSGLSEYNLRVIVSGSGTILPDAEIFRHRFSPIIILTTDRVPKSKVRHLQTVADEVRIVGDREIDFAGAFHWLRTKWSVKRLLCEGGGALNAALFAADVVNELHLTICPKVFGGSGAPTIADGIGTESLREAAQMKLKSIRRVGDEVFLIYQIGKAANP